MPEMLIDERTNTPYEVVGESQEQVETQEPEQPAAEEPSAEKKISENEKERREEQSARDRLKIAEERLEQLKQVEPVYRLITEDEKARAALDNYLRNGEATQTQRASVDEPLPQPPTMPEKPFDYNAEDARLDQSSSSAKFEREMQRYQLDKADYLENLILSERKEREKVIQQQRAVTERERALDAIAQRAVKAYGVPEDRSPEYRNLIASATSELEEKVWAFYFTHSGKPGTEELLNQRRKQDLERQRDAQSAGLPAAAASTTESMEPEGGPPTKPSKAKKRTGSLI